MGVYTSGVAYRGINRAGGEFGDFWTDEVNGWNGQTFYTIPTAVELGPELTTSQQQQQQQQQGEH